MTVGEGVQLISARFIDGKLIGGDIKILAMDKSKLAVRAGGYSISTKGAKIGMGASYAFIY